MSREEVSVLGSARREEVRRQKDESDRYRANPLLYLVSPQVKVCSASFFAFHLLLTLHKYSIRRDYFLIKELNEIMKHNIRKNLI